MKRKDSDKDSDKSKHQLEWIRKENERMKSDHDLQMSEIQDQLKNAQKEKTSHQIELNTANAQKVQKEKEIASLNNELGELKRKKVKEGELSELQTQIQQKESELTRAKSEVNRYKEEIENEKALVAKSSISADKWREQHSQLSNDYNELKAGYGEIEERLRNQTETNKDNVKSAYQTGQKKGQEMVEIQMEEKIKDMKKLQNELSAANKKSEALNMENSTYKTLNEELADEVKELEQKNRDLTVLEGKSRKEKERLQQEVTSKEKEVADLERDVELNEEEREKASQNIEFYKNKLQELKNQKDDAVNKIGEKARKEQEYEGYLNQAKNKVNECLNNEKSNAEKFYIMKEQLKAKDSELEHSKNEYRAIENRLNQANLKSFAMNAEIKKLQGESQDKETALQLLKRTRNFEFDQLQKEFKQLQTQYSILNVKFIESEKYKTMNSQVEKIVTTEKTTRSKNKRGRGELEEKVKPTPNAFEEELVDYEDLSGDEEPVTKKAKKVEDGEVVSVIPSKPIMEVAIRPGIDFNRVITSISEKTTVQAQKSKERAQNFRLQINDPGERDRVGNVILDAIRYDREDQKREETKHYGGQSFDYQDLVPSRTMTGTAESEVVGLDSGMLRGARSPNKIWLGVDDKDRPVESAKSLLKEGQERKNFETNMRMVYKIVNDIANKYNGAEGKKDWEEGFWEGLNGWKEIPKHNQKGVHAPIPLRFSNKEIMQFILSDQAPNESFGDTMTRLISKTDEHIAWIVSELSRIGSKYEKRTLLDAMITTSESKGYLEGFEAQYSLHRLETSYFSDWLQGLRDNGEVGEYGSGTLKEKDFKQWLSTSFAEQNKITPPQISEILKESGVELNVISVNANKEKTVDEIKESVFAQVDEGDSTAKAQKKGEMNIMMATIGGKLLGLIQGVMSDLKNPDSQQRLGELMNTLQENPYAFSEESGNLPSNLNRSQFIV